MLLNPGSGYIMSIANTKNVHTNGMISVSHSQLVKIANSRAAVETKNNNQYVPLFLLFTSMS